MIGTTIVVLTGVYGSVVVDSVAKECYAEVLRNDHMNGEFPILKPGENAISWTGDVNKIVIRPNWRFL